MNHSTNILRNREFIYMTFAMAFCSAISCGLLDFIEPLKLQTLPDPWEYDKDNVEYFPAGNESKLVNQIEAAKLKAAEAKKEGTQRARGAAAKLWRSQEQ